MSSKSEIVIKKIKVIKRIPKTIYFVNGNVKCRSYLSLDSNGDKVLNSINDHPAYIEYYENGNIKEKRWYKLGKIHRESFIHIQKESFIDSYTYYGDDVYIDAPAVIKYNDFGVVISNMWYKNGIIQRDTLLTDFIKAPKFDPDRYEKEFKEKFGYDLPAVIEYEYKTGITIEKWYKNGVIHRDNDLPAYRNFCDQAANRIAEESWYQNGLRHRDNDKPAFTIKHFESNHLNSIEVWFQNGKIYREDNKPVRIHYKNDTNIIKKEIYLEDIEKPEKKLYENKERYYIFKIDTEYRDWWIYHRLDGPAMIEYDTDGNKIYETWMKYNKIHREGDLPSEIDYYPNGNKSAELWSINNRVFRLGYTEDFKPKPSLIKYNEIGDIIEQQYLFGDQQNHLYLTENKYIKILYLFRRWILKFKKTKRKQIHSKLIKNNLFYNNKDVSNLICKFVY